MPRVLILSSYVAASRVGGGMQALALARLGIEPVLVPTVIFGRHPGHGAPGGAAVEADVFESVLGAVEAQGAFAGLDAAITGYFASAQQVAIAAESLVRVRTASPAARLVVDPIMGDEESGLYVREPVAEALADELLPLADLIAPNAWELARLAGRPASEPAAAVAAARGLGKPALVSSVRAGEAIGVVYATKERAWLASHPRAAAAPKGTGDLLTALFVAGLLHERPGEEALAFAVGAVAEAVEQAAGAPEFPIAAMPADLRVSGRVGIAALDA